MEMNACINECYARVYIPIRTHAKNTHSRKLKQYSAILEIDLLTRGDSDSKNVDKMHTKQKELTDVIDHRKQLISDL